MNNKWVRAAVILAGIAAGAGLGLFLLNRRQANIEELSGEDGELRGEEEIVVLVEPEQIKSFGF